jgi:hypothetical protein
MPSVLRVDPFSPVLLSSPALDVTQEQKDYIRNILDVACSDSRFAEKAYIAIAFVLSGGSVTPPVITGLNPSTAVVGSPSFTLHVMGTGFSPLSVIVFNGGEEPTTYVSDTELTTDVDMSTVGAAVDVPVHVVSGDGVISDPMTFSFTAVAALAASAPAAKTVVKK